MNNEILDFSIFENSSSKFSAKLSQRGGYINFSNSGKGGDKKFFTLGIDSFITMLNDISKNISEFSNHENYVEKEWRDLGSAYYTDGPANAMSTVQTKPLFSTLSKIILWANSTNNKVLDPENKIDLSPGSIQNALLKLSQLAERFSPKFDLEVANVERLIHELIIEDNKIRDFAFKVFSHFYGENWLEIINQTIRKQSAILNNDFISHDFNIFPRLIGEFSTPQSKESLTSSNTQRYFEEPIFQNDNKYYYFSTQWNGIGENGLSYNSLVSYFEKIYPTYFFKKTETGFQLYKSLSERKNNFSSVNFHLSTIEAKLFFSNQLTTRFIASLLTKPFVICTGLSGSGKTKLAQSFVKWISKSEEQYKIVPVGADWTNREPLLGFPDGLDVKKYVSPDSGALELITTALKPENKDKPYFLILDEMNLSHVERYFADFLSIMESKDNIKLYSGENRKCSGVQISKEVAWPDNFFIIGTVNIDETTYMFSPKVLDRANVIEFRITKPEIEKYLASPHKVIMKKLFLDDDFSKPGLGSNMATDFLNLARNEVKPTIPISEELVRFFAELKKTGAEFGYRSASEINRLIAILETLTLKEEKWDDETTIDRQKDFIDIAIMQKLLPKLHGSRNKLTKILPILGGFCLDKNEKIKENYFEKFDSIEFSNDPNINYKISFEKICRMYKNAVENGYASYAEA